MTVSILTGDGLRYQLTSSDLLWLARAADGEGGDPADTIWTWIQRFALPNFRARYPTLAQLVQAHSQPVNPAWRADGRFCRPGGAYADSSSCSTSRLERRAFYATAPLSALSDRTKQALAQLEAGTLPNHVARAVDFATRDLANAFVSRTPGAVLLICRENNCFLATAASTSWPDNFVRLSHGTSAWWWLVPAGLALGAGAWWWYKRGPRSLSHFNLLPKGAFPWL